MHASALSARRHAPANSAVNFARRSECYKCHALKTRDARSVPSTGLMSIEGEAPVLMVKHLLDDSDEGAILVKAQHWRNLRRRRRAPRRRIRRRLF